MVSTMARVWVLPGLPTNCIIPYSLVPHRWRTHDIASSRPFRASGLLMGPCSYETCRRRGLSFWQSNRVTTAFFREGYMVPFVAPIHLRFWLVFGGLGWARRLLLAPRRSMPLVVRSRVPLPVFPADRFFISPHHHSCLMDPAGCGTPRLSGFLPEKPSAES